MDKNSSDLTAVVIASMLGEPACEIYSDVPGVYTADPYLALRGTIDSGDCLRDDRADVATWCKGAAPQGSGVRRTARGRRCL
ncbi:hypothetical protein NKI63_29155 [Mesorhizobium sp. M0410]|uniref:amino acid kinase family protein n=1 Tax=Mesorhizobium sp. M0410 TaxID=2956943 RepID=UPI00333627F8